MPHRVDDFSQRRRNKATLHPLLKIVLTLLFCTLFLALILLKGS